MAICVDGRFSKDDLGETMTEAVARIYKS